MPPVTDFRPRNPAPDAVSFHDLQSREWETKYKRNAFASRHRLFTSQLSGLVKPGQTWADIGCGTGVLSRWLAQHGAHVHALDAAAGMVEQTRRLSAEFSEQIDVRQGQADALPFPDQSCDGIVCSSVVEYVSDPELTLREVHRVLRSDGVFACSVPNRRSLFRKTLHVAHRITRWFGHPWPEWITYSRHEFSFGEAKELFESCGLAIASSAYFGGPMPAALQSSPYFGPTILLLCKRV